MGTSLDSMTVEELFSGGNYVAVVMRNDSSCWQTYAAMGLVGLGKQALVGLNEADSEEALFYRGVAHWIDGNDSAALKDLGKLENEHAKNLVGLIKKPKIDCLTQLAWRRHGAQDLITGIKADKKFRVQNISFHKNDLLLEPYASIHRYYDESSPPDLYIAQMVEWHLIPPDLQELPCPIFGQSADYDAHIQAVYPWLNIFDEMVAADQVEWQHISALTDPTPVSTFPKIFGVAENLPPVEDNERPLDLLITGSVIYPYWPEKIETLFNVLDSDELEYKIMQGYMSRDIYDNLLATSKLTISKLRRPSLMPTRVLDAVSMGCATIVQEGSVILLYLGDDDGVITFDDTDKDLAGSIKRVIENWPEYRKKTLEGAKKIRRDFALAKVSSQYFRYLTYLAAKPRSLERAKPKQPLLQRRVVSSLGWRPDTPVQRGELLKANMRKCAPNVAEPESVQSIINWAREFVVYFAERVKEQPDFITENADILKSVLGFYRTYINKYPSSFVLKFNYIRTLFHWGDDRDRAEALEIVKETLSTDPLELSIDVFDDVFSWDVFNDHFNYRDYFDAITKSLIDGGDCESEMKQLIVASLYFYAARITNNLSFFKNAVGFDPKFPHFRLECCRALLQSKSEQNIQEASQILFNLSNGTVVYSEAFDLLETIQMLRGTADAARFQSIARKVDRWRERTIDIDQIDNEAKNAGYLMPDRLADDEYKLSIPAKDTTLVTAICILGEISKPQNTLDSIIKQTVAKRTELILYCDNAQEIAADPLFGGSLQRTLCLPTNAGNRISLLNEAVERARGKYITFVQSDLELKADALQILAWHLENEEEHSVAYADLSIHNENDGNLQYIRRPDFTRRDIFSMDYVNPIAMWSRTLHKTVGFFKEEDGDAAQYSFWLEATKHCKYLHIPMFLGKFTVHEDKALPVWLEASENSTRVSESHWPEGWGERPKQNKTRVISQNIVETAAKDEMLLLNKRGLINENIVNQSIWYLSEAKILIATGNLLFAEIVLKAITKINPKATLPIQFLKEIYRQQDKKE
ncbi:MAG: glycosyltransferase family 2 protein [Proteobacteria bacterium]|nr:glycosyltransferase family 2 protein [Pseudomonadota bacterium]